MSKVDQKQLIELMQKIEKLQQNFDDMGKNLYEKFQTVQLNVDKQSLNFEALLLKIDNMQPQKKAVKEVKEVVQTILSDKKKTKYQNIYEYNKRKLDKLRKEQGDSNEDLNMFFYIIEGEIQTEADNLDDLLEEYDIPKLVPRNFKNKKEPKNTIEIPDEDNEQSPSKPKSKQVLKSKKQQSNEIEDEQQDEKDVIEDSE